MYSKSGLAEFSEQFGGVVIDSSSDDYAEAVASSLHAEIGELIVRPNSAADVALAVRFAVDNELEIMVRSGGHGVHAAMTGDGILIDMRNLAQVAVLSGNQVQVGSGATWIEVAEALAPHGLAITSGDTASVGVGGLTVGGGVGWLVRSHGLTIDNLVAAEVVTANGEIVRASHDENADLFWAIRGGGGNFGIITTFTFEAAAMQGVVAGVVQYELSQIEAVIKGWRDVMRKAPEKLNATFMAMPAMGPDMPPSVQIAVVYCGTDEQEAMSAINPLLQIPGFKEQNIKPAELVEILEERGGPEGGPPMKFVSNNGFAADLHDELIASVLAFRQELEASALMIRSVSGAFNRIPADATAFSWRDGEAIVLTAAFLPLDAPEQDEQRVYDLWAACATHTRGAYGNFLSVAGDKALEQMYSPETLARLRQIKHVYDPQNVFRRNANIQPVAAG